MSDKKKPNRSKDIIEMAKRQAEMWKKGDELEGELIQESLKELEAEEKEKKAINAIVSQAFNRKVRRPY